MNRPPRPPRPPRVHTIFHSTDIESAVIASSIFLLDNKDSYEVVSKKTIMTHKMKPLQYGPATTSEEIRLDYARYTHPVITAEFQVLGEYEEPLKYAVIEKVLFDLLSFSTEEQRTIRFVIKGKPSKLLSVLLQKSIDRFPETLFVIAVTCLSYVSPRSRFVTVAVPVRENTKSKIKRENDLKAHEFASKFIADVAKDVGAERWNKVFEKIHALSFKLCATSIDAATLAKAFMSILGSSRIVDNDSDIAMLLRDLVEVEHMGVLSNKISLTFDHMLLKVTKYL